MTNRLSTLKITPETVLPTETSPRMEGDPPVDDVVIDEGDSCLRGYLSRQLNVNPKDIEGVAPTDLGDIGVDPGETKTLECAVADCAFRCLVLNQTSGGIVVGGGQPECSQAL